MLLAPLLIVQMEITRQVKKHYRVLRAHGTFEVIIQAGQTSSLKEKPTVLLQRSSKRFWAALAKCFKTQYLLPSATGVKSLPLAIYRYSITIGSTGTMYQRLFTGRNEVVAKVIFLHLSVIHSVHRGGGGLPQCMLGYHHPPGTTPPPPRTTHTPQTTPLPPPRDQTPRTTPPPQDQTPAGPHHPRTTPPREHTPPGPHPPQKQTPAYGLRAAGTHPTGMHSCV